jgi:hypothetical protein
MKRLVILSVILLLMAQFLCAQTWQLVYKNKGVGTKDTILAQLGVGRSVLVADVNKDGVKEIYTTAYTGHKVIQFEVVGNDSVELKYIFPDQPSAFASEPRDIEVGDLDNDVNLKLFILLEGQKLTLQIMLISAVIRSGSGIRQKVGLTVPML